MLLRHLNKGNSSKAIYRGSGSIGIIGAARLGMLVAEDPDSKIHRIVASTKHNLAKAPDSLRFTLEPMPQGVCRIAWCGISGRDADSLIGPGESDEEKGAIAQACEILKAILEEGPKLVS